MCSNYVKLYKKKIAEAKLSIVKVLVKKIVKPNPTKTCQIYPKLSYYNLSNIP